MISLEIVLKSKFMNLLNKIHSYYLKIKLKSKYKTMNLNKMDKFNKKRKKHE